MIYPRLFEDFEQRGDIDVSDIPFTELRDKVLGAGKKVPVKVDDSDHLWRVDGKIADDLITWEYLYDQGKTLGYIKKLMAFLNDKLDIDVKKEIDQSKKIRKRKTNGDPNHLPEIEIPFTFGEFWEDLIDQHDVESEGKEKAEKIKTTDIDLEQDYPAVHEFFTDRGKILEITDFILNIPQSGGALVELKDLLRIINSIILKDDKIQIHKGGKDVHLPKDQYEKWKEDMVDHIGAYEKPEDLDVVYETEILKTGTFLNYLFNLEPKGVGRGEYMLVYCIPNSALSGGSEDYDIEVFDQAIYEVKDYSKTGSEGDIRLGTHGKLSQFDFFQDIKNLVSTAKKIWDNVGPENLRKIVGKYNFQYWKYMTSDKNFQSYTKAIPSAVNAGELPPPRLKIIIDWCFLNNLLIEGQTEDNEEYTMAVLRGNNLKPRTVKIDPVKDKEISGGKSVKISELEDQEKMFNELRALKYIRDPHQLVDDLQNSPKDYFDKVKEKMDTDLEFYFLIFRPKEIKVLRGEDFNLATITQSSIKISEGDKKQLSAIQDAFKDYKKLRADDAAEDDFWDYYRKTSTGSTNESYYPRIDQY